MHKNIVKFVMLVIVVLGSFISDAVLSAEKNKSLAAVEAGKSIAEKYCSRCHAVEPDSASPHKSAPPFQTLSRKWPLSYLEESLAEGITVGHPDMPEFKFEPEQISDLLTYLHWLGRKSGSSETPKTAPQ